MFITLEQVGFLYITFVCIQLVHDILNLFYINVVGPTMRMNVNPRNMGKWAVVTGATDGIGSAFARKLAELGMDVVLIARKKVKLVEVGADIEAQYNVQVKLIVANFYNPSAKIYHNIEKELYGLEVGCLINNVGVSYPHPDYLMDLPVGKRIYKNMISCNVVAITNITKMILPQMVQRGKGVIVNLSSNAAIIPSPLLTVYGATKSYVEKFTKDLHTEYQSRGIIIQCLMPGNLATKIKIQQVTWLSPTPQRYVDSAIDTIGIRDVTTGYTPHSMLVWLVQTVESIAPSFAVWVILRTMEQTRQREIDRIFE